jgi:hypothetical protein
MPFQFSEQTNETVIRSRTKSLLLWVSSLHWYFRVFSDTFVLGLVGAALLGFAQSFSHYNSHHALVRAFS